MAMTRKDKIGVAVLIAIFISFIIALIYTIEPLGPAHDPQDSPIVQQRIDNLKKSQ